jgi:hypothetical protein
MACIKYACDATTAVNRLNPGIVFERPGAGSIASPCLTMVDEFIVFTRFISSEMPITGSRAHGCNVPQAFLSHTSVGLAESGQRREEGPLSGRIKVGLGFVCRSRQLESGRVRGWGQGDYTANPRLMFSAEQSSAERADIPSLSTRQVLQAMKARAAGPRALPLFFVSLR